MGRPPVEIRLPELSMTTPEALVASLRVTATLAVVRLAFGLTVSVSLAVMVRALVLGEFKVVSLATANVAKPLVLNNAMASARR